MKKWYTSKIVWAGISAIIVGVIDIVSDFLVEGVYDYQSIFTALVGLFVVVSRIWFTDKALER